MGGRTGSFRGSFTDPVKAPTSTVRRTGTPDPTVPTGFLIPSFSFPKGGVRSLRPHGMLTWGWTVLKYPGKSVGSSVYGGPDPDDRFLRGFRTSWVEVRRPD